MEALYVVITIFLLFRWIHLRRFYHCVAASFNSSVPGTYKTIRKSQFKTQFTESFGRIIQIKDNSTE